MPNPASTNEGRHHDRCTGSPKNRPACKHHHTIRPATHSAPENASTGNKGTLTPVYIQHPPIVSEFIKLAYEDNWVRHDFDWPKWIRTTEAQSLVNDTKTIEQATTEQLAHLLTAIIRQDRFVDNAVMHAFNSGLLLRVLQRIRTLDQNT